MGKKIISYDNKSMIINGKRVLLYGGEFQYFRVPNELWEDRFKKMKMAGLNFITTYIPWNFHETKEGKFRWDGDRDLNKFLSLAEKYGLYVAIKPGPYICAEWDFGGFPDWLLAKDIPLRENNPEYIKLVKKYYKEIAKVIKPHLITEGGNIILFQIENEYDHLILFTGIKRYKKNALKYHLKLLQMAKEEGIDVPTFTVEGSFLRKTEIIDARTYYPNIPWIWLWEFNDFDKAIKASVSEQKNKPLMIMELETGWFAQFGKPLYEIEPEVTKAIIRTVLAEGASVMNLFMFVGGTTFPYWNCKGDYGGIGTCTTYDFGVSPIREWGEVSVKYHLARNTAQFINSFQDILFDSEKKENAAKFVRGGETIALVKTEKSKLKPDFSGVYENVKIIEKYGKQGGFLMVRNVSEDKHIVGIEYFSPLENKKRKFPLNRNLNLIPRSSFLFPIDIALGDSGVIIKHSTSELLLKKKIDRDEFVFFSGKPEIKGQTYIKCDRAKKPAVLEGDIKIKKAGDGYIIEYENKGIKIIKIDNIFMVFLDEETSYKVWDRKEVVLVADYYFIEDISVGNHSIEIKAQLKKGNKQMMRMFTATEPKNIKINNKDINFKYDKDTKSLKFCYDCEIKNLPEVKWITSPKFMSDMKEKSIDYNDSNWKTITLPNSLEEAGFLEHGFIWYRKEFYLQGKPKECRIKIITNDMDRLYIYINGKFIWRDIGSPDLDITNAVKKGKNLISIRYENAYHTKAHPHEGPIKKLSGIMEPVKIYGKISDKKFNIKLKKLKVREGAAGLLKGYQELDFDDSKWNQAPSAEKYVFSKEMGELIWFRRKFKILSQKDIDFSVRLRIEYAFERCIIYVNGRALGKYESVGPQNDFYIPKSFLQNKNVLAIILEGPGFHPVKESGFLPPILKNPVIGFYYFSKKTNTKIT